MKVFEHPPYRPDLGPSDMLKDFLRGRRYGNDDELKEAVNDRLNSLAASVYAGDKEKLLNRSEKCLDLNGDHVE